MTRLIILLLTLMTGFSGLVYEVAWQKYLGILLGSHAGATAAVLAIFLGGLSVGYWLFGRITQTMVTRAEAAARPPRLLMLYGGVEAAIGLYVIAFPWLFQIVMSLSQKISAGSASVGFATDLLLSTLLIGPASILMGATIPVLTQSLARDLDEATRIHAFIYAFNTVGAFVGALAAGFYLVPTLGLIDVMLTMGAINLSAGAIFILLSLSRMADHRRPVAGPEGEPSAVPGFIVYAAVALLVGYAMMSFQTTMIRIGALSFGSSEFTFSMVVSVFVLCIAIGSFAVSAFRRIPPLAIVLNIWALALYLFLLYFQIPKAPYVVHVMRALLRDIDESFALYHFLGFLLLAAAIGLPVILSGAMLPLLFHQLRRQVGHLGDLAGNLYSWNTIGSLLGALIGGYTLFFFLDLDGVYCVTLGALFLAASLLTVQITGTRRRTVALVAPILLGLAWLPAWEPELLTAGLFRGRAPLPQTFDGLSALRAAQPGIFALPVLYHEDDPMATITVRTLTMGDGRQSISIITNGKSDGSTVGDYSTMALAALLPTMMADQARSAFVIGWGTGVTVGELASIDSMQEIVVAEISRGVIGAAPLFESANRRALSSPDVTIIESDAYRALLRSEKTFDVIVSEPSNPWVSGVEKLFSVEFLTEARQKLSPGGVYAQWFHLYETDEATLTLILRTFASVFGEVSAWKSNAGDVILLGFAKPGAGLDHYRLVDRATQPEFRSALSRAGIGSPASLLAREVIPIGVIHAGIEPGPLHSLFHPILSDTAGRAFFKGGRADFPFTGIGRAARLGRDNAMLRAYAARSGGRMDDDVHARAILEACGALVKRCATLLSRWAHDDPESALLRITMDRALDDHPDLDEATIRALVPLFEADRSAARGPITAEAAWRATNLYSEYYHHAAPFDPDALTATWERCHDSQTPRAGTLTCAVGFEVAIRLLESQDTGSDRLR